MCGVWKSYDAGVRGCSATVSVLRDVGLDVATGEMVGIIAAPASGKTTLLMCAGGMMRPDRGTISWFGAPLRHDASSRPEGIAFAGDRPFPYGFLTIREAVEYAAIVRDLPIRDAADRVHHALERVSIAAIAHRRVDTLDGNSLARLSVAAALLARPRLILVDDFAPGCDVDTAGQLLGVLRDIARDGAGVVIAGRFVARLAALYSSKTDAPLRVLVLANGRLESTVEHPDALVHRMTPPLPYTRTRVAELSPPPSAARENEVH
jgi:ABC-2 type transport system ATP-binding protein